MTNFQELAPLYAADLLEAAERKAFERELRHDPALQRLVRDLSLTTEALALACPRQSAPLGGWNAIRHRLALDEQVMATRRRARRSLWLASAGWAVAACLVVLWSWQSDWFHMHESRDSAVHGPTVPTFQNSAQENSLTSSHESSASPNVVGGSPSPTNAALALARDEAIVRLLAQLQAARQRETMLADTVSVVQTQVTNLLTELHGWRHPPPGVRRITTATLVTPEVAAQATPEYHEALLRRFPVVLEYRPSARTAPPKGEVTRPNPLKLSERHDSVLPEEGARQQAALAPANDSTSKSPLSEQMTTPTESPPVEGIVSWDGQSPTFTATIQGLPSSASSPTGTDGSGSAAYQIVAWSQDSSRILTRVGTLSQLTADGTSAVPGSGVGPTVFTGSGGGLSGSISPNSATVQHFELSVPPGGWNNGLPNLFLTLEPANGTPSQPTGPGVVTSPQGP